MKIDFEDNLSHLRRHIWTGWNMFSMDGTRRSHLKSVLGIILLNQIGLLKAVKEDKSKIDEYISTLEEQVSKLKKFNKT